jgi:prepilin-type N-terminal cleavage/methylation domain-containing protein
MNRNFKRGVRRGFTFVELLAVVLILAVLAGVAIPMYINSRRSAAARACLANIRAIASAESAYYLRNGTWATTVAGLVGQPEGLATTVTCPLDRDAYTLTVASGALTVACPNDVATGHAAVVGTLGDWDVVLTPPAAETIP